jgi:molybdopterin converting factor subunit 1
MKVKARLFASLRERAGGAQLIRELQDGSTVGQLWKTLQDEYPELAVVKMKLLYAVNRDYVSASHVRRDGDEVAFVPPVSGG